MDNLLNFFNTLLGIEVAIFGIISAVILVFIQLVYSNYTYKHISHILKNKYLIFFYFFSIIDLILTSAGSYFLSLTNHNFFPNLYLSTTNIITNQFYALICLILIFISISFFVTLITKNITYLQPHRAIFLLSNSFKFDDIRDFIWKKYSLEPPFDLQFKIAVDYFDLEEGLEETEEEKSAERKIKEEQGERKLKEIEKQIEIIKKKTANSEDPILPIRDMMIQFIRRSDLSSLNEAQGLLLSVATDFINRVPEKNSQEWSPNNVLGSNFIRYLIELLSTLLEIAEKEGLESAKKILLNIGFGYALRLFDKGKYNELDTLQKFFQQVADSSIGKSSLIFQEIIEFYQAVGGKSFDLLKEKSSVERGDERLRLIDNIFVSIGWLGERLLAKLPLEDAPIMRNLDYSTEYDTFLNCLLTFSHRYDREQPGSYPLIYFDSLYVVLKKLVQIYKANKINGIDDNIYSISFCFASFAESAISVGNSEGASLAAIRIKEAFKEIKEAGLTKEANSVIRLLVKIGILAAGNKEKLPDVRFLSKPLDLWVADTLIESGENVESEVLDCYIHTFGEGNHDSSWAFITNLGMRMRTNFGFAFDSSTGKLYPDDDPRRK